jgi:acetyltransferase-like isoleucine patch superfamily enzyme
MLGRLWRIALQLKAKFLLRQRVEVFGNFTVINPRNVTIGTGCAINHGVLLLGRTRITIGDDVVLSARCMILDGGLSPAGFDLTETRDYEEKPITLETGAWIGAGAIILPGVTIGERAIVGAGSVVTKNVAPGVVVGGNPAKQIGRVEPAATALG